MTSHAQGEVDRAIQPHADAYRPDIDGLRAVAVTSVIAYHVGIPGFSGGFVGVDIFFVISGFLITRLLLNEIERTGRVSFLDFYARRIRRLLPAALLVLIATLALSAIILVPIGGEQQRVARSAVAAALFWSNIYFLRTSGGYFDPAADQLPLLHTWSLSVEEQFYFVWPFLLAMLLRVAGARFATAVAIALGAILVASFAANFWMTSLGPPASRSAFYLTHLRAWEFAVGGLAWVLSRSLAGGSVMLAATGTAAVLFSVTQFDDATPFPGSAALLPTLGTAALILAGGARPELMASRVLAWHPFVNIGLLSYSWYLWHWPLLAIARSSTLGERHLGRDIMLAMAALGLAWLTYRWIETPIRRKGWGPFATSKMALLAGLVLTGMTVGLANGLFFSARAALRSDNGWQAALHRASLDRNPLRTKCHQNVPFNGLAPAQDCTIGAADGRHRLVIWGDSHADHLLPLYAAATQVKPLSVLQRTHSACPPILGVVPRRRGIELTHCDVFNRAVLDEIRPGSGGVPPGIILAARWNTYLGRAANPADRIFKLHSPGSPDDAHASLVAMRAGLVASITALRAVNAKVLLSAPIPELRYSAPECLARQSVEYCSVPRQAVERDRSDVMGVLREVAAQFDNTRIWDPLDVLCDATLCKPAIPPLVLYLDDDHLTAAGSAWLVSAAGPAIDWLLTPRVSP